MPVHGDIHAVVLRKGHEALSDRQGARSGDDVCTERLSHLETAVDLLVGKAVIKGHVVTLQFFMCVAELSGDA